LHFEGKIVNDKFEPKSLTDYLPKGEEEGPLLHIKYGAPAIVIKSGERRFIVEKLEPSEITGTITEIVDESDYGPALPEQLLEESNLRSLFVAIHPINLNKLSNGDSKYFGQINEGATIVEILGKDSKEGTYVGELYGIKAHSIRPVTNLSEICPIGSFSIGIDYIISIIEANSPISGIKTTSPLLTTN